MWNMGQLCTVNLVPDLKENKCLNTIKQNGIVKGPQNYFDNNVSIPFSWGMGIINFEKIFSYLITNDQTVEQRQALVFLFPAISEVDKLSQRLLWSP